LKVDLRWVPLDSIVECARKEFEETKLLDPTFVRDTSFQSNPLQRTSRGVEVLADLDFLRYVLAELLRNARTSVKTRNQMWTNWENGKVADDFYKDLYGENWRERFEPYIGLRLTEEPEFVTLTVVDSGEAAVCRKAWNKLKDCFDMPLATGNWSTLKNMGVQFCRVVCARLSGELTVKQLHDGAIKLVQVAVKLKRWTPAYSLLAVTESEVT
jgi:hypothetical protein